MPQNSVSLWPDAIRATVQSPLSILVAQAEALTEQTSGLLVGELTTASLDDGRFAINFSIQVPDLHYKHRIMVVRYARDMPYPCTVDAEVFRPIGVATLQGALHQALSGLTLPLPEKPSNQADTDKELIDLVRKVFQSSYVISVAQSLIARASDVRAARTVATLGQQSSSPTADNEVPEQE